MGEVRYPTYRSYTLPDRLALRAKFVGPGFCPICGSISLFSFQTQSRWLRESLVCRRCGSRNRQRQLAYVLLRSAEALLGRRVRSVRHLASIDGLRIYNTEAGGALHKHMSSMKGYCCSEYFGPEHKSGEIINGVRHEDLMAPSFAESTFDIVISADVLEHVPDPYRAHKEIYRVLKPGGRHVFTVPFYQTDFLDEHRTRIALDGSITYLREPAYHLDPLRPEGTLVHTVFSLEMLVRLAEIGFRTNLWHLYKPHYGILGTNAIVLEAIKP